MLIAYCVVEKLRRQMCPRIGRIFVVARGGRARSTMHHHAQATDPRAFRARLFSTVRLRLGVDVSSGAGTCCFCGLVADPADRHALLHFGRRHYGVA